MYRKLTESRAARPCNGPPAFSHTVHAHESGIEQNKLRLVCCHGDGSWGHALTCGLQQRLEELRAQDGCVRTAWVLSTTGCVLHCVPLVTQHPVVPHRYLSLMALLCRETCRYVSLVEGKLVQTLVKKTGTCPMCMRSIGG